MHILVIEKQFFIYFSLFLFELKKFNAYFCLVIISLIICCILNVNTGYKEFAL